MMSHDEANELLAVAALHAVDAETLAQVEEHAATCPRCQSELDANRAVAAAIGNSVEELPEGLWTNISSQLWERKGDRAEMPPLVIGDTPAEVVAIDSARSTRRRTLFGAVGLAAAASIVALAIGFAGAQNHVNNLQTALRFANRSVVQRALAAPGREAIKDDTKDHIAGRQQPAKDFIKAATGGVIPIRQQRYRCIGQQADDGRDD